jgi:hypothetical protein
LFIGAVVTAFTSQSKQELPSVAWNSITAADANELFRIQKVIAYLAYGPYGQALPIHKLIETENVFKIETSPFYPTLLTLP